MAETVILDPGAVALNREEWDITQYIAEAGPDWGDASVEQYMAETEFGSLPVDLRVPSRTVTIPLLLLASRTGATFTFEEVRRRFQHKAAMFQRRGGWLSRTKTDGSVGFADITGATLKLGGSTAQALWGIDADAILTLTCLADWYGEEEDGGTYTSAVGASELIFLLTDEVKGDYPARVRIKVDELDGKTQRGLMWGFRSQHYSSAVTAKLVYDANDLTEYPINTGSLDDVGWRTIMSTDIDATNAALTHEGSYHVWAKIHAPNAQGCYIRLVWDIGDLILGVENPGIEIPSLDNEWLVDLGDVHLNPAPVGTHRWRGVIQVKNIVYNESSDSYQQVEGITVDKIWLQPTDESAGYVAAPVNIDVGLSGLAVHDEFNQTAGFLTGKTPVLDSPGAWAAITGGDTDDFGINIAEHNVQRATASDTSPGRRVYLPRSLTDGVTKVDSYLTSGMSGGHTVQQVLIFRYVNSTNFAYLQVNYNSGAGSIPLAYFVQLVKVVGGVGTDIGTVQWEYTGVNMHHPYNVWSTMQVMATSAGYLFAWWYERDAPFPTAPMLTCTDETAVFATGGALAAGYSGIGDYYNASPAVVRKYDNFAAWVPDADAVLYANGTAEMRFDGHFRENVDGSGYGPVSHVVGDLPRLPASGMENRQVEVLVKPTAGDLGWFPDVQQSRIRAQVLYRPCHLYLP